MRTFREYLYYFIKKGSERSHRGYYHQYYKNFLETFRQCTERKDDATIRRECRALQKFWRVEPLQYYRFNFYRRDCPFTVEQMKEYIPDFFAYYLFFPKSFKDRNILCEDKQLMSALNAGLGLRQPATLFCTREGRVLSAQFDPLDAPGMTKIIAASKADKIFVKPTFGVGGKGIVVFNRTAAGELTERTTGTTFDAAYLTSIAKDDYTIQEGVRQAEAMNRLYSHAINTFRIVTDYRNGKTRTVIALLRMGCGGMQIDNASSGGIYIKIDIATGRLTGRAIADNRSTFDAHPDTGVRFEGFQLPHWEQIVAFTEAAAAKYAPIRYIGWDIALSEEGPLIIEGNNGPGIEIIQDLYGGLKPIFGIGDPDDYWFSKNYSLKDL